MISLEINKNGKQFTIYSNINITDEAEELNNEFFYLDDDETVLCAVAGSVGKDRKGILVCTTKFVYYFDKGFVFGGGTVRFPASSIDIITIKNKIFSGSTLHLETGVLLYTLNDVPRTAAQEMYTTLQNERKRASVTNNKD